MRSVTTGGHWAVRAAAFGVACGVLLIAALGLLTLPLFVHGSSHELVRTITLKPIADATYFDTDPITPRVHFTVRGRESVLITGSALAEPGSVVPRVHAVSVPLLKFNIETLRDRYVPRGAQVAEAKLILRQVLSEKPRRVDYTLTTEGEHLLARLEPFFATKSGGKRTRPSGTTKLFAVIAERSKNKDWLPKSAMPAPWQRSCSTGFEPACPL